MEGIVTAFMDYFHAFHGPTLTWALAIPAAAVSLRLLTFAALNVPARVHSVRFAMVRPLLVSTFAMIERTVPPRHRNLTARGKANVIRKLNRRARRELTDIFGWKPWTVVLPFLQFPTFIIVAESLRRLAGRGSFLFSSVPVSGDAATAAAAGAAGAAVEAAGPSAEATYVDTASMVTQWMDPALHTEGMLWFTDLCVPDPYLILPATITAVNIIEVLFRGNPRAAAAPPAVTQDPTLLQRLLAPKVIRRMLIIFSIAYFPVSAVFPAAVQLYWISSTLTTATCYRLLDRYLPQRTPLPKPRWPYQEERSALSRRRMRR